MSFDFTRLTVAGQGDAPTNNAPAEFIQKDAAAAVAFVAGAVEHGAVRSHVQFKIAEPESGHLGPQQEGAVVVFHQLCRDRPRQLALSLQPVLQGAAGNGPLRFIQFVCAAFQPALELLDAGLRTFLAFGDQYSGHKLPSSRGGRRLWRRSPSTVARRSPLKARHRERPNGVARLPTEGGPEADAARCGG